LAISEILIEEMHMMKKISALALAIMMGLTLTSCGSINNETTDSDNNSMVHEQQSSTEENNILVAYFSHTRPFSWPTAA